MKYKFLTPKIKPEVYFKDKTVSIVCCGASLLERNYAKKIDSADIVIRVNHGAKSYKDYSKFVGSKFDMFAFNFYHHSETLNMPKFIKNLNNNIKILSTRPLEKNLNHGLYICDYFIPILNIIPNDIYIPSEKIFTDNILNGFYNFSSGLSTLLYVSQFETSQINFFGFDQLKGGYFYQKMRNLGTYHKGDLESKVLKNKLRSCPKIKHYT